MLNNLIHQERKNIKIFAKLKQNQKFASK